MRPDRERVQDRIAFIPLDLLTGLSDIDSGWPSLRREVREAQTDLLRIVYVIQDLLKIICRCCSSG